MEVKEVKKDLNVIIIFNSQFSILNYLVSLTAFKVLPFDNKNKKMFFYFVLFSLNRTFVPRYGNIICGSDTCREYGGYNPPRPSHTEGG